MGQRTHLVMPNLSSNWIRRRLLLMRSAAVPSVISSVVWGVTAYIMAHCQQNRLLYGHVFARQDASDVTGSLQAHCPKLSLTVHVKDCAAGQAACRDLVCATSVT